MTRLVDAATVAHRLGFTRDYVYRHQQELGALRFGDGPRGRLRFDLDKALAAATSLGEATASPARSRPAASTRAAASSGVALLPIKGRER